MNIVKDNNHYCSICGNIVGVTKNHIAFTLHDNFTADKKTGLSGTAGSYNNICPICAQSLNYILTVFFEQKRAEKAK
jgi:hypothetical protein